MHVDKDFELSKTQISQHLAWLSPFLKLWLYLNAEIRVIFSNNIFLLSKFHSFTHVTSCYLMLPYVTAHVIVHVTVEISYFVKIFTCYHMLLLLFIKKVYIIL